MKTRIALLFGCTALLLSLVGCQRLNDERTVNLPLGSLSAIEYSAPRYEQKVTVTASSPGAPVTVYLVRKEESEAAQRLVDGGKAPTTPLAGKEEAEEITLEATVPPKTAYVVILRADKKNAEVKLKVIGR
jgi:hypothetical protein